MMRLIMRELVGEVACHETYEQVSHRLPASHERPGYQAITKRDGKAEPQTSEKIVHRFRIRMMGEMHCIDKIASLCALRVKVKNQPMQPVLD